MDNKRKINNLKVSVLICTFNRGLLIEKTLESLIINQTIKADEIIVVNGGGLNNCESILQNWSKKFSSLKIIRTDNINLANSRNIGLKECHGDLILLTDDDARPYPDWIENIKKYHFKFPNAGLIGGDVLSENNNNFLSKIADVTTFPRYNSIRKVRSVPGVNSSYKMRVIKMVGEYDISLKRGEDVDFNWRVKENGWDIIYVPDIKVKHVHRESWSKLCYQHYMYGRSYYLIRNKWKSMYSIYPHKINSFKKFIKYLSSWTYTPMMDAYIKSKKFTEKKILAIIVIFLINMFNRSGIFIEKNFYGKKK